LVTKTTAVAQSPKKKWGKDALLLLSEGGDGVMAKLEVCSTMVGVAAISTTMQRR